MDPLPRSTTDPTIVAPVGAKPVLRVRSLADLIALVPVILGFEPRESLVIATIAGRFTGFSVRVDLPPPSRPDLVRLLAQHVSAAACTQQCTRVAVMAFSDDPARAREVAEVLDVVADRLAVDGVEVTDVLRIGQGRYWSLRCAEAACCPPEGTVYDARSTQLRADATLAGIAVAPGREALAARLAAVGGERARAMQAATTLAEQDVLRTLGLRGRRSLLRPPRRVLRLAADHGAARVDRLLDRLLDSGAGIDGPVRDADAAALAVWCSILCLRDLAWSRIDRPHARQHLALWSNISRLVVAPYEPAVVCLAGFAAWLSGDGASAWCAIERVEAVDPHYSMAGLLRDALERCVPPDVWEPLPRELVLPRGWSASRET